MRAGQPPRASRQAITLAQAWRSNEVADGVGSRRSPRRGRMKFAGRSRPYSGMAPADQRLDADHATAPRRRSAARRRGAAAAGGSWRRRSLDSCLRVAPSSSLPASKKRTYSRRCAWHGTARTPRSGSAARRRPRRRDRGRRRSRPTAVSVCPDRQRLAELSSPVPAISVSIALRPALSRQSRVKTSWPRRARKARRRRGLEAGGRPDVKHLIADTVAVRAVDLRGTRAGRSAPPRAWLAARRGGLIARAGS